MEIVRESNSKRPKLQPSRKSRIKKTEVGLPICEPTKDDQKDDESKPVENAESALGNQVAINIRFIFRAT